MNEIELRLLRAQIMKCVDEVDAGIVEDIRRAKNFERGDLLNQLDVLEKVRERLNVRFERFDQSGNANGNES